MQTRAWWWLGLLLNAAPSGLVAQAAVRNEFREVHLGMEVRLALVGTAAEAEAAARAAYDRIDSLNLTLSDWDRHSEARRLESHPVGHWVPVSAPLKEVLALALDVARATDGAFDPTIGPLTALWRESRRTGVPASDSAVSAARLRTGYRLVELDTTASRVRFLAEGMRLDLGAVAKGWILDDVLVVLRWVGVHSALIEAGGDLVVMGAPPDESGWRIAIGHGGRDTVLVLTTGAVSSSGPWEQAITGADGSRESHVMVITTGRGAIDGRAVTVIGPRAAITDALATALTLVPQHVGDTLARRYGVTVMRDPVSTGP